jgi:hypothetical protein
MEYKIAEDVAQAQLDAMEAEFGGVDPASADVVFEAIRRGLVDFDEATGEVTYHLQRPLDIDNPAVDGTKVTLHEPGAGEMEKISRGLSVTAKKDGTMEIDAGHSTRQTLRMVTYLAGWPSGLPERIKRRDMQVLQALSSFFV